MVKRLSLLALAVAAGVMATGCANTEQKLGRGIANVFEPLRMGEMRRSMEQTAIDDGPDVAYTTGFIHGFDKTVARTGVGLYEIVTCPLPPYGPVCTDYLAPGPVYPDNNVPDLVEGSTFATDTNLGFSGGSIAPWFMGSRFYIFETH